MDDTLIDHPQAPTPGAPNTTQAGGCTQTGLIMLIAGWVIFLSLIALGGVLTLEQALFEGSFDISDVRWFIVIGYGAAVLIPAVVIWAWGRTLPLRRYFAALALAGLFAALLGPARLAGLTNGEGTAALQIGLTLVFLIIAWVLLRRSDPAYRTRPTWQGLGLALLLAAVIGIPWVVWGAIGSVMDLLLNLAGALLFGFAAGRVLETIFYLPPPFRGERGVGTLLVEGLMAALALLVMVTGFGANGNQGLLALTVPVLGWALAAMYIQSTDGEGNYSNRPVLALLVGLAAFWVLAFFDADELSAIILLGFDGLIQWSNLAAFVALLIGAVAGLALLLRPALARSGRTGVLLGAAGLAWLAALALYFLVGQPGMHGERLFVILSQQADISGAAQIADPVERRTYVYNTLVDHANTSQAEIRSTLDGLRIAYQPYYLQNAIEVQGGPLVRLWLERQPEVDRVLNSPVLRPLPAPLSISEGTEEAPVGLAWNLQMIGADRVWTELGVRGEGIIVGQSDSGAEGTHPELADSYRGRDGENDYNWFDPWYGSESPVDLGGHGTHTLGTIVGNNTGVAPDAEWIGCVNLGRNLGNPALYLDCMQFNFAPFPQNGDPLRDGQPERGANVLNNSWGCPEVEGCDPNALQAAVEALRTAGVFVVASAGNSGSDCGSVEDPIALYDAAYSVGAVDSSGELASFSSIGPVEVDGSGRIKPDIAAPGVAVPSSMPGGTYASNSGTSMAGPHVVGVVALMWSANPDLIGEIDRTEQILNETAQPYEGAFFPQCGAPNTPNNAVGYGIVDAYQAVLMALEE